MFSHRSLLKQALNIAWKHKYLWFFGLFASFIAASGSWEYQILTNNVNQNLVDGSYSHLNNILAMGEMMRSFCLGIANLFQYDFLSILNALTIILVTLILLAIIVWLAISSQAALVDSVKKLLNSRKKDNLLSIRESLTTGHLHFWPVLGLNITIKILTCFIFLIVGLPLLFMVISNTTTLAIIYTVLFVIFIPVATGLSLIIKYAIAYQVLEKKSFVASLEHAEKLFRKNWLVSLEMAVILFIINFLASGLILLAMSLILLPLLLLGAVFNMGGLIIIVIALAILLIIIVGSFLTTFQIATWTSLFLRLKEKGGLAKLERIFRRKK
jgi:hypothetical protein